MSSLYGDLIPAAKGSSSAANAPTKNSPASIYGDLIPTEKAPAPEKPGLFQSIKNFFGNAPETPAPAPAPVVAPVKSAGKFQDLIPPPKAPEVPKQGFLGNAVDNVSRAITNVTEAPANAKTTMDFLPSELFRHLPFGIGAVLTQIQDDPQTAAKLTLGNTIKETPGAALTFGKEIAKGVVAGALDVAGVAKQVGSGGKLDASIHFNIPGLGEVSNNQFNAVARIANGEDPVQVAIEEGSTSIFNTLFFADLAMRPFSGRPVKVAEFQKNANVSAPGEGTLTTGQPDVIPAGTKLPGQIDYGPKTGRLYTPPEVTRALPPEAVSLMEKQGISLGPDYNPELPTFFRVTGGKGGLITGEVVQVRPSYFDILMKKLSGGTEAAPVPPTPDAVAAELGKGNVPDSEVTVLHQQSVDIKQAEAAAKTPVIKINQTIPPIPGATTAITTPRGTVLPPAETTNPLPPESNFHDLVPTPENGFNRSANQTPVGKIGNTDVVIGDYGTNAIERKTTAGQVDRLPVSDLQETIPAITESFKAGDTSFRKDNVVHIAKMPDGETRAVVTRLNKDGQEEVINFFKIGRPVGPFIENLKKFGTPDRSRTGIRSLEPSKPIPLTDGGVGSVAPTGKTVKMPILDESSAKMMLKNLEETSFRGQKTDLMSKDYTLEVRPIDTLSEWGAKTPEDQPRIDAIKKAILDGKELPPVMGWQGAEKVMIHDGHNRVEAYKELGYREVPVLIEKKGKGTGKIQSTQGTTTNELNIRTSNNKGTAQEKAVATAHGEIATHKVFSHLGADGKGSTITDYKTGLMVGESRFKNGARAIADVNEQLIAKFGSPEKMKQAFEAGHERNPVVNGQPEPTKQKSVKKEVAQKPVTVETLPPKSTLTLAQKEDKFIQDYLESHQYPSVHGFKFAVDTASFNGDYAARNNPDQVGLDEKKLIAKYKQEYGKMAEEPIAPQFQAGSTSEEEWDSNPSYGPRFYELSQEVSGLRAKLIPAKGTERVSLETQIAKVTAKMQIIEDDFIKKFGAPVDFPAEAKPTKAPKKSKSPTGASGNYSIGTFRDGTTPLEIGGTDKVKVIELPEMVQLAKELMGQVPKIREKVGRAFGGQARGVFSPKGAGEIRLRADLFDPAVSSVNQAAMTLAHEIGHLTDYLPNLTLKRGNLMGRLLTLRDFRKDFLPEAGQSRTDSELRQQLWDLSKYWKPVDEATAPASFIAYRKSAKEIYADFISVLFNDPKLAADMAPTAYNLFFEHLDKKPLVRDAYFEAQALLSGDRIEVIKARRTGVQQMFKDGDYKAIELQNEKMKERELRNNNLLFKAKFELIDKNAPLIDRVAALEKKGVVINPDDNPVYYLEERNYLGGKIKAIMETDFNPVYQDLQKASIPWTTFGEELFYQRIIAGDRSNQANPRGITSSAAQELHDNLVGEMTPEQAQVLTESVTRFRDGLRKVADEAFKEGLYKPDMYKQMQENPAYVTFQVIDHLENAMTSKVYRSIGTLKDITNPADASILKMIATVHAIERNKVTRISVDFLKEYFPEEIEDAKKVFNGTNGTRFIDSRQPNNDTVIFYREGKMEGHYVDSYIKKSLENESVGQSFAIISGLRFFNSHLYRPLFIGFNLGFQSFNFVRDFKRFYKNIPDISILGAFKRYYEAYPAARTRSFGPKMGKNGLILPEYEKAVATLTQLERDRVLSVTFNDILAGGNEEETQIERILRTSGIDSFEDPKVQHAALKPFVHVLEFIKKLGDLIETLPKVAGYYQISADHTLTKEDTSYIRKNVGSPDFLAGGHLKPATNEIFLFSNAITQGIRSDFNVGTGPKTRSAYWWKTLKINLIPKLLMLAAGAGIFGEEIKKIMEDASEYDKTNYSIIPLGTDSNGKSIYFRMPEDEGGRLVGGIFWKAINASNDEQPITKDLADIAAFAAGQIPNISPSITAASVAFDYLSGQNPYDSFRGRNILSDDVFKAGGWRANKAFLGWEFNQLGGGIFYRFGSEQAVPTEQGPAEKVFNLPVVNNVVGRFFRVTDYGTQENLTKIRAQVQSDEAAQRLNEIDAVNAQVKIAQQDKNLGANRRKYDLQLVNDYFGHTPKTNEEITTAKRLIDRFHTSLQKGGGGAEMNALIGSTSNEQKVTVLREIKKNMTEADYQAFKKDALHNKITTPEVFHTAEQKQ